MYIENPFEEHNAWKVENEDMGKSLENVHTKYDRIFIHWGVFTVQQFPSLCQGRFFQSEGAGGGGGPH